MMISITRAIKIGETEIELKFVRSSGPGGQHVNKVSTTVQLRFDVQNSPSLPNDVRNRLLVMDKRITDDGVLIINATRFRTQEQNRRDAIGRLVDAIRRAAVKPKHRIQTKPSLSSIRKRKEQKRRRSMIKKNRVSVRYIND